MKKVIKTRLRPLNSYVLIPGSKSITNRALLLAALADGVSELNGVLLSDDTHVFITALRELGIVIEVKAASKTCIVHGGTFRDKKSKIYCGDAGTAARFILAVCASIPGDYEFDCSDQMRARPLEPLLKILSAQGAKIKPDDASHMPLLLRGIDGLEGGEITVEGSQTGQFASALLLAAPLAQATISVEIDGLVSAPYINMTCLMMGEFGVLVRRMRKARYVVPVPQDYVPRKYFIEPDMSTASYFFAAAAVTRGSVTIQAFIVEESKQADTEFLLILEKMGCIVTSTHKGVAVKGPDELNGVSVDMRHCSDVFMTLAAIAPFATSPTTITNIGHARLKESDRIAAMEEGLRKLNVKVETGDDWMRVYPSAPIAGTIDSFNDHRIAMAFAIIGLRVAGIKIDGAECVTKTCPEFFTLWDNL